MTRGTDRVRPLLRRGADGRLRPVSDDTELEIADVWAEQRRTQLRESIHTDKRKASKEFVLQVNLPKLHVVARAKRLWRKTPKKLAAKLAGGLAVVILVFFVAPAMFAAHHRNTLQAKAQQHGASATGQGNAVLDSATAQHPDYPTLLPAGKTIEDLGGWGRVSPLDKDPVYAYADTVNGVHITVSQQPLPSSFSKDLDGSVAQLARQFSANDKLSVSGTTAYLGTSVKGPQSVILAENHLLILIKSDTKLTNQQWITYIDTLQPS